MDFSLTEEQRLPGAGGMGLSAPFRRVALIHVILRPGAAVERSRPIMAYPQKTAASPDVNHRGKPWAFD